MNYGQAARDRAAEFLQAMRDRQIIRIEVKASGSGDDGEITDINLFDVDNVDMNVDYRDPLSNRAQEIFYDLCDPNFNNEGGDYVMTIDTRNGPGAEFVLESWDNEIIQHYSGKQVL